MNPESTFEIVAADPRLEPRLAGQSMEQALRELNWADRAAQIFTYDAQRAPFYQLISDDASMRFGLELLKRRAERPKEPQTNCPICLPEVQRKCLQHWFEFHLFGERMVALANPFAFLPCHTTLASAAHEPQSWRAADTAETGGRIERVVRDLFRAAALLPSFVLIFNASRESGASLPDHRHLHAFELPPGYGPLAIQQAAAKRLAGQSAPVVRIGFEGDYPARAARFTGDEAQVVQAAAGFLKQWDQLLKAAATANLIAVTEEGQVALYVILRHSIFRHAQGFEGILGAAEMAGLVILSADYEFQAVREGKYSFASVWQMIAAVCPPEAQQMG